VTTPIGTQKSCAKALLQKQLKFLDVVAPAGAAVCFLTLTGYAGRFWWPLEITCHFRLQYAVLLSGFTGCYLLGRKWRLAAAFSLFAALNWIPVTSQCWLGQMSSPSPGAAKPLRVMLMNVCTENQRYDLVQRCIADHHPDLIVLEELDERWLQALAGVRIQYPYSIYETREDNFGIALLSRLPLDSSNVLALGKSDVPSITATMRWEDQLLTIIGTHPLPPGGVRNTPERDIQLIAAASHISQIKTPTILLGDLNTSPWSYAFQDLLRNSHLKDSSRGHGFQPTWPANFPPLGVPIDHCLHSPQLQTIQRHTGPRTGSDHLPIIVDLVLIPGPKSVPSEHL
jgi:endonuclease/exonuclease/phosphatase (EEP) superfamily protein YafD